MVWSCATLKRLTRAARGLIRIAASSLNFQDLAIIRGQYGEPLPKPGFVPVSDGTGEIIAVGPLDRRFSVGDRVAGIFRQNWLGGKMPLRALESRSQWQPGWRSRRDDRPARGKHRQSARASIISRGGTLPCAAVTAWLALSPTTT